MIQIWCQGINKWWLNRSLQPQEGAIDNFSESHYILLLYEQHNTYSMQITSKNLPAYNIIERVHHILCNILHKKWGKGSDNLGLDNILRI